MGLAPHWLQKYNKNRDKQKIQANISFAWIFVFYSCLAGNLYVNSRVR